MKSILPFFTLLVVFASCTTAYKSGQTPDDVYYSPARPQDEYVRTENRQNQNQYDEQYEDDRYLRMKVHNRHTWSDLDYYYNDPFAYNYNYLNRFNAYGSIYNNTPWNYYSSWNYYYNPYSSYYNNYNNYNPYYNPYGSKVVIVNANPPVYNRPRTFNLNVYSPSSGVNSNSYRNGSKRVYGGDSRDYNYNTNNSYNSRSNAGSSLRSFFGSSNNSSSNMSSSRPSSNTSSSGSSHSSSSAPVRRF